MTQQELQPVAPAPYEYPAYPTSTDRERRLPPPSTTAATWALVLAVIPIPLANIVAIVQAIGKPVLLLNGDSHVYRSDNPLQKT
ncbi:MAG: hypothetical protein ABIR34_04605, partial [Marmoricola sp.]